MALAGTMATAIGANTARAADKGLIGISMPEKTTQRWIDDGNNMVKLLASKGYGTALQYADDDIPNQVAQIENMISSGAKVLIIAALDGTTLSDVLAKAHERGVKVISYDRLIRNSPNVDYYATFDNFKVGVLQGTSIADSLGLKDGKGPFNIELFGGSPDDNNAYFFYNGALSVLQPYLDSKKLVVGSGQVGMKVVATPKWDAATAQSRMDNLLSAYYTGKKVDAVLAPNDNIAIGVISSLKGVGYGTGSMKLPVVTGQDCQVQAVKAIEAGEQTSSIFKDTRQLAKVVATMVDALLTGSTPEVNDTKTYDNGVKVVPTYLLNPVLVTKANWRQDLVDSGYYTSKQLGL
ncbi:sugar ABC transporter substrate-binding protein [Lichenihabitans sp. Uapishka_5]|uniref:multiple monosaccharide ABC transporter substrate-binding protein n=1 Tax=Lichenihabitans sp. Uapishka_5 TaxID=3037302 RepID=UPI0029E810D2|nr:multiple monosaccharide ABC transporter substrate-binding protein [Lichenihabitans sp. Uapishka_5]MDX7953251.1 sugar ABC transporter substrate-binding protein [Lichenihabitans sp. Uapishka_5]